MKNYVKLRGNLGAEPTTVVSGDRTFTKFNLAINDVKLNKDSGEFEQTKTHWIPVVAFQKPNNLATRVIQLKKGDLVQVEGKISSSNYEKEGLNIKSLNIIADDVFKVSFLES